MTNFVRGLLDAQGAWAKPLGDLIQKVLKRIFAPIYPVKDFLNGTWLGHPLHPVITDVPIGAFTVAIVLDIVNIRDAADIAIGLGILTMLGAALAGLADYTDTDGRPRDYATVHTVLMVVGLVLYIVSLVLRRGPGYEAADRTFPILLSWLGYVIVAGGAYVGGELVYTLGNMVDRHAWRGRGEKWQPLDIGALPDGQPTKVKAGAQTLVVVRQGGAVYALHDTCAHAGCSLSEGKLVDGDQIECPCHGSRYRLRDGRSVRGPAVYDQPAYEVRQAEGRTEVRRAQG